MKNIKKQGISLIVLVITIIIIIILAGAIILSLNNNNPIESANKARFISDVSAYKSDLEITILNNHSQNMGEFDPESITDVTGNNLKEYIPSMRDTDKNKFIIILR
ncbi:MAG: hypothetical protein RSE41_06535, partial [Clostridia bacterium]